MSSYSGVPLWSVQCGRTHYVCESQQKVWKNEGACLDEVECVLGVGECVRVEAYEGCTALSKISGVA